MTHDNILRRIFVNASILVAGKGANAIFSLAYMALAVRALGVETFGLLVLIHTYAQAVAEMAKLRSWEAVLRFGAPALRDQRSGDFQTLIRFTALLDGASGMAGATLAVLGSSLAAQLLGWPAEQIVIASLYCLSVLFMAPATPTGLLRLFDRFDLLAAQSAVASFVRMAGSAILLAVGGGLGAFLALWFLATLVASTALVVFAWRETLQRHLLGNSVGTSGPANARFPGIWRFVWTTNLNSSIAALSTHVPTLLTGGLLGSAEAALLRIAREVADAAAKPIKLLIPAIFPELTRLVTNGATAKMREVVTRSLAIAGSAALAGLAALWLTGDLILGIVGGDAVTPAYDVMLLLGAASLMTLWAFPLEPLLISVGLEGAALRARLAATLLYVPLVAVLLLTLGLAGAGVAAIAASLLMVAAQATASISWFARATPGSTHQPDRDSLASAHCHK